VCLQYWSLLNWRHLRFGCGFVAVPVNWNCVVISPYFAIFKNVVHSLKPGETFLNIANYLKTVRCGCGYLFNLQSNLDITKLMGLFFTSSNYPKCKLICTSGILNLLKKSLTPNFFWRKKSKCIFYSERRFEHRRIRYIRVRDIEIRLYLKPVLYTQ